MTRLAGKRWPCRGSTWSGSIRRTFTGFLRRDLGEEGRAASRKMLGLEDKPKGENHGPGRRRQRGRSIRRPLRRSRAAGSRQARRIGVRGQARRAPGRGGSRESGRARRRRPGRKSGHSSSPGPGDPEIIRTGDVAVEVESYEATYTKLSDLMTAEKGQISSANTQKMANGKIRATVILRVPPERFEAVLRQLKEFGTIQNRTSAPRTSRRPTSTSRRAQEQGDPRGRLKALLKDGKGTVKELMEGRGPARRHQRGHRADQGRDQVLRQPGSGCRP
jgi:hypothetical protein